MKILEFEKLDSTQKKAKELVKKGKKPWTVILAKEQKLGYGRKGNLWYSPKGGLYFSIILPRSKIFDLQILTILSAFSIAQILKEDFNLEPLIKLPNDVLVKGKKICGILTENVILGNEVSCSIMGVGLNTNIESFPEDLEKSATSLKIELKRKVDNKRILKKVLVKLKGIFNEISK